MAFCKVQFVGNLGRDPEMRYTAAGLPVTQFSVAVNQGRKNQQTGEWSDETDWFRVSVFGNRAEWAAESLRKGNKVLIDGRFKTRPWQDANGVERTSLDVSADSVVSLERREREEGTFGRDGVQGTARPDRAPAGDTDIDDLPF